MYVYVYTYYIHIYVYIHIHLRTYAYTYTYTYTYTIDMHIQQHRFNYIYTNSYDPTSQLEFLKKLDQRLAILAHDAKGLAAHKKKSQPQPLSLHSITDLFRSTPQSAANRPVSDEKPIVFDDDYLFNLLETVKEPRPLPVQKPPAQKEQFDHSAEPLIMTHFLGDLDYPDSNKS